MVVWRGRQNCSLRETSIKLVKVSKIVIQGLWRVTESMEFPKNSRKHCIQIGMTLIPPKLVWITIIPEGLAAWEWHPFFHPQFLLCREEQGWAAKWMGEQLRTVQPSISLQLYCRRAVSSEFSSWGEAPTTTSFLELFRYYFSGRQWISTDPILPSFVLRKIHTSQRWELKFPPPPTSSFCSMGRSQEGQPVKSRLPIKPQLMLHSTGILPRAGWDTHCQRQAIVCPCKGAQLHLDQTMEQFMP